VGQASSEQRSLSMQIGNKCLLLSVDTSRITSSTLCMPRRYLLGSWSW